MLIDVLKPQVIKRGRKKKIKNYQIDSRKVRKGDVFFAIIGKEKNGHDYIEEVIKKKASVVIVSEMNEAWLKEDITILKVEDTTRAMLQVAHYLRKQYSIPIVAVTGSVGKTTTKELIFQILKTRYHVLKSPKNYNNRIGIPLTLFKLNDQYQIMVLEFGMNHAHEIEELSYLCEPDVSLITNIGTAHIGYLNGKKNIAKAKLEILKGMKSGYFIQNPYDPYLKKVKSNTIEVINPKKDYDLYFTNVQLFQTKTYAILHYQKKKYSLMIPAPGKRMLENVLLAVQVGLLFQIPIDTIINVIEQYTLPEGRGTLMYCDNQVTVINDTYNASLESLENNLTLLSLASNQKYLIFGDFLELGKYAKKIHKQAAKMIRKVPDLNVILIGKYSKTMKPYLRHSKWYLSVKEALSDLRKTEFSDCTILVKGSRKMNLDQIVDYFKKEKE